MLGQSVSYQRTPFFYLDQYDVSMEYRGWAPAFGEVVFRGDPSSLQFLAFWLQDGRVAAAMNVNTWGAVEAIEDLLLAGAAVERGQLVDPDVEL